MFDFYESVFLGTKIPREAFPEFYKRAQESLERLERYYAVESGEEARKLALCAMAEHIYESTGRRGVSSASVGQVSVKYKDIDRGLYDCAATYLEIYRGVEM